MHRPGSDSRAPIHPAPRPQPLHWLRCLGLAALALALAVPAAAATPQVAKYFAQGTTFALGSEGTVLAFGDDSEGQLGIGRPLKATTPVQVTGLDRVRDIAVGTNTAFALREDGTVWGWGANPFGVLLDGTGRSRSPAIRVQGLSGITALSVGSSSVLALKSDGTVWVWGYGDYNPTTTTPVQVPGLSSVVAVSNRYYHMVALKSDGSVWTWGHNNEGQLGLGTQGPCNYPCQGSSTVQRVPGLDSVVAIDSTYGEFTSFALKRDGSLWAWGANAEGQLGDGTLVRRTSPTRVPGLPRVVSYSAGIYTALAVAEDGRVYSWGSNRYGELGNGRTTSLPTASTPGLVPGLSGIRSVSTGSGFCVAVDSAGEVWTWGLNLDGELGNGAADWGRAQPGRIRGLSNVKLVRSASSYTIALKNDGTVWAWGSNNAGQLGNSELNRNTATVVPGLADVVAIASRTSVLALLRDGSVSEWGALANNAPARVALPVPMAAIAAGVNFNLAAARDGSAWGWGYQNASRLGRGANGAVAQIQGIADVTAVAAGSNHSLFLRRDGTVWAMGANEAGQLGVAASGACTYTDLWTGQVQPCIDAPVRVPGLSDVTAVFAFDRRSYAITRDGSAWAWGDNRRGEIGLPGGDCSYRIAPSAAADPCFRTPQRLSIGAPVVALSDAMAATADGRVWAWGLEGAATDPRPRLVNGLAGVVALATSGPDGYGRSTALVLSDGSLWTLGRNVTGQLGDGTFADAFSPVRVVNAAATAYVSLAGQPTGPEADPLAALRRVVAMGGTLDAFLTDPRASGLVGEVYFTALLPARSPLLGPCSGSGCAGAASTGAGRVRAAAARRPLDAAAGGMVAGVLSRGGFKQTSGASFTRADNAYSGALADSGRLSVYRDAAQDPLENSNAIICMGVTIPELSAKGQVLMRPIATGTAIQGVVQCPPVQTAATIGQFQSESSGPLSARTIVAVINPLDEDRGRTRRLFSWAVAPDGRQFMQTGPNQWEPMTEPMRPAATITVPATGPYRLEVTRGMDLSGLAGTLVFIGMGDTWEEVRSLNKAGLHHTVQ